VDVFADVALLGEQRRSRVQADPERDPSRGEFFVDRLSGLQRALRRREGDEEGVALGVDLDSRSSAAGLAHDAPMLREPLRVRLGAKLVQELGRALHVRKEESDGARRTDGARRKIGPHVP
jgi:hypothetical protein